MLRCQNRPNAVRRRRWRASRASTVRVPRGIIPEGTRTLGATPQVRRSPSIRPGMFALASSLHSFNAPDRPPAVFALADPLGAKTTAPVFAIRLRAYASMEEKKVLHDASESNCCIAYTASSAFLQRSQSGSAPNILISCLSVGRSTQDARLLFASLP